MRAVTCFRPAGNRACAGARQAREMMRWTRGRPLESHCHHTPAPVRLALVTRIAPLHIKNNENIDDFRRVFPTRERRFHLD